MQNDDDLDLPVGPLTQRELLLLIARDVRSLVKNADKMEVRMTAVEARTDVPQEHADHLKRSYERSGWHTTTWLTWIGALPGYGLALYSMVHR